MKKLINLGVRPEYKPWEIFVTRRVNIDALIGGFNVGISFILFPFFDIYYFQTEFLLLVINSIVILFINRYVGYLPATYLFNLSGIIFMAHVTLKLGIDSYVILFFFPLVLGLIQLLSRKETVKHLIILLSSYIISIGFIAVGFMNGYESIQFSAETMLTIKLYCLILGMTTSLIIFSISTLEALKKEELIKKMLREKEILLAEVYHRVKNNMNIVTSLLNIKKNNSNSIEVKEALESCRNRVYSMALVHGKIFSNENISKVNFSEYTSELLLAIQSTFGFTGNKTADSLKIDFKCDEIVLGVSQAIPCGLIINELVTNSFKHANPTNGFLHIQIYLRQNLNSIVLIVKDNGVGFNPEEISNSESMGYELVKSLCEQLDASFEYQMNSGAEFTIKFEKS